MTSAMMEDNSGRDHVLEENEVDVQTGPTEAQSPADIVGPHWSNGQCVLAVRSCSVLNPSFDLSCCRANLENDGFQIPVRDLEAPLRTALESPIVRRYMVFNSAFFHFILAPVLYMVVWCAVFSTLHLYIAVSNYWVLCLSVSLVSILLTTAIIFILHYSIKELNMNLDVRLIPVNERMAKHKLLVAVADWVKNCNGNMKLYFVYWDMSQCLRVLTERLEEHSLVATGVQEKFNKKMSHLVLVSEVKPADLAVGDADVEQGSDEQRPLLRNQETSAVTSPSHQKDIVKATTTYSLVPEASLPAQAKAYQLLMTYSAVYVKLLVSQRISRPPHQCLHPQSHCTTHPTCLCQFVMQKVLQ